ncbi:PREDICTED: filament-like plant protein 6 isoform X1 [Brassica oleracea var. oleracea]|uniref:Filament-like plant protein 6 n=1 Tax=Brassica oleracea var. oleracea TaxID=109376 RepID=A0A0D3DJW6_BRAOL|nr:PREDICTED: filament-like plant protein 6 isoform X1 [Brassica oleracea var. oleracea]XP_013605095.1 PREDICTED: filament-like plant protein 6 isoform X1 [Brassica oleracea var. oleracea]
MDRRSWPWKKKPSDKTTLVLESADTSHPQVEKKQDVVKKPKYVQISVEQYTHLTTLEEQIKTYDVQIKSYESQVEAYEERVKSFEEQIEAYDEKVQSYAEQVETLNGEKEDLSEKLTAANEEIDTKEALVKQHCKVAEDAVAGWEKADAEALTLKNTLESVTLSKLTAEDRAAHLDGALKECMRQIRSLKKDHEVNLHDLALSKSKEIEKLTMEFEKRISEYEQELLRSGADSDALSRTLQERSNMLVKISEEKARADAEIETLKSNLEMCEREIKSLKYEVHVVSRELEIRNEEKNMCIRSAEVANKQHLEGVKKVAKLEGECQRLRSLVRKKLPGPAALAQMKLEVESLGVGGDTRVKRSPSKASSPGKSPRGYSSSGSEFSVDTSQKVQKENEFLTERLLAMEEETKMLKEALAKRNNELLESRNVCAQSNSKLQGLEAQLQQINSQKRSNPSSSISVSEDGNDDSGSCSGSLSTNPSQQQSKKEKEMAALERVESVSSHVELMDDFLEMEKLACLPNQSSMDSKDSSGDQESELVNVEAHTKLKDSDKGSPAVMEFRSRLSKVLESVSADAELGKIVEDVKRILQEVNACMDQDKPSDVQVHPEEEAVHQDLKTAVSRIHEFVLLLRKEVRAGEDTVTEGNDFVELIDGFSITYNHVLSGHQNLDDFVSDLANVFNEAMELKVTFKGLASSEVEVVSPDCIDKVAIPESKAVAKEIYENGCVHNEPEVPCDENRVLRYESESTLEEIEELKSEKEKMAADIEELKCQLQESEKMLGEIRSQLDSAQRSNSLADTQLRCMTESYRSLETRAADLEIDVNQLKEKVRSLEDELEDEKRNHQESSARCHELEEHIQRSRDTSLVAVEDEEADNKTKQERELTAAAEKLAECQETIFVLGKQLKSLRPPPQRQSESYSEDELGTKNYADLADNWVNEVPRFMESPNCPSDSETSELMTSPSRVGSRLSRSGSSGNPTPEKASRGISRFFSTKSGY